ncbi:N-acetyltransferase [Sphaerisporangium rufum]|uniref:N-acetyltransferase n=1 Tax=Sphaerisporangium rufum TaxID=1381558 RepID=A0A919QW46_9ACTN|nr:GNAT family protein [Sphaerisporangium rufum]GII75234.1 N-acetyltransferase [Sphaerisporangium rufum]
MIEIRGFRPEDAAAVASWVDGPAALATWSGNSGFGWPFDAGQLLALRAAQPGRRMFVAVEGDGPPLGLVTLLPDRPGWVVRLGLVIVAPAGRGRGAGAAMVGEALRVAFEEMGAHRVDLGVYLHNTGATRLYERLGFRHEGVRREMTLVEGEWWSAADMSILDREWRR